MQPLLKINDPGQWAAGLWPDLLPNQPQLWADGSNVIFSDGQISKFAGWTEENTIDETISGMAQAYANGERRVYYGAEDKLFRSWNGAQTTLGTGYDPAGRWDMQAFGTFLLATNNVDTPVIWENTGSAVPWPTVPFARARLVKKLEVFPVLFHGQEIAWPSYNNFKDFVPGPGKRAGQFFVRDLDGEIMAAEPMGENNLVFYSADMWGFMRYVGGEAAMSIKAVGKGIGAVGPKAVAATGGIHFGWGPKGIWRSDGSAYDYVAKPAIQRWINEQVDHLRLEEVVAVSHDNENLVEFFFPCKDGEIRGVGFSYAGTSAGKWTKLKAPVTAAANSGAGYGAPVVGLGTSWGFFNTGNDAGDEALPSNLVSFPLDMGSSDKLKRWQMLQLHYEASGSFEFRVGYSNNHKAAPEWQAWRPVTEENWLEDRESNFITVEFRSTTLGSDWRLSGFEVHGVPVGRRR